MNKLTKSHQNSEGKALRTMIYTLAFLIAGCFTGFAGNQTEEILIQQQQKQVSGTVVDAQGLPVIGANIIEEGTTNGTITDLDGNFTLQVEQDDATLRISYIGYIEQLIDHFVRLPGIRSR